MRKSAKIIAALSVAGLAVAAGSAFTAGNSFETGSTAPLTGYASTDVTGAAVKTLEYNFSVSGANIESTDLVLVNDTTTSTVELAYNNLASFECVSVSYDVATNATTYLCDDDKVLLTEDLDSTSVVVK